jgi:hypothetical protein
LCNVWLNVDLSPKNASFRKWISNHLDAQLLLTTLYYLHYFFKEDDFRFRNNRVLKTFVCLFTCARAIFQLFGGCHHYRWQGCKFRSMLSTHGFLAVRVSYTCYTYCNMGPQFIQSCPKDRHTHPTVGFEHAMQRS